MERGNDGESEREREREHKNSGGFLLQVRPRIFIFSPFLKDAPNTLLHPFRYFWIFSEAVLLLQASECFHMVDPRWATQTRSHKLA